ncbi:PhnD/SsuA/transferrin family substrate-binding protein [Xanthobacter oligotrophicus]|uniref:PhnD/SsuA/transferrin family substrate-binding protein n=1 Tax=Xanthobacter oligotrophicus TaxID=2607286 RepID=UPI001AEEC70C|nr:PhnD/SsuA/transferrin family substrate-binding protein [Xanthobacter oligotrophicus]MCG5237208.1 PhnD/SsuA/transferrin family substrate-binding protein [Xanthobacter oligotrophicus]
MTFSRLPSRRLVLAAGTGLVLSSLSAMAPAAAQGEKVKLLVGYQDLTVPSTVDASKVLEGAPYEVEWVILPGPAAQLSALYSKNIDVGHMGDTSLIIEQGKAKDDWSAANPPLQIVAGWRANDAKYPPIVTVVRTDANINTLAELRGKKWAYNFGGFNYLQYVLSGLKAGLTPKDYEPVQLGDQNATAAAFNSGRVDAYSGSIAPVGEAIEKGAARVIVNSDELDIPALNVFTARGDVLKDPAKKAAIADFLARVRTHWTWYANNLDTVEKLYIDKVKQTPARAKLTTVYQKANFRPLDDDLVKREQHIADVLFEAGAVPKKIDVNVEFNRSFNAATVGGN